MDPVLEPFRQSTDDAASRQLLGDLLSRHAAPVVRRVVSRRLGSVSGDVDDVCSQVLLQLMVRLRREQADSHLTAIDAFASYAATAAQHGCDHYIRAKHPIRWRLRNRICYVLGHDPRFALWRGADGSWVGGLESWRSRPASSAPPPGAAAGVPSGRTADLLRRLFDASGTPLELNAIVDVAASAWAVPLRPHEGSDRLETVADREPRVDAALEQRARLIRVWAQICQLPLRQRHALLLNLRDDGITLFLTSGAASMRDLAAALELSIEEFVALWDDLPLPDAVLAARLACSRQQVINLRMSARKRLAFRLGPGANIGDGRPLKD